MKKMIDIDYEIGEIVFLKTDPDQLPRIVVNIQISSAGTLYKLASGINETYHYDIEISSEKDYALQVKC